MNGNTASGYARQELGDRPRVTAAVRRTEAGEILTEYEIGDVVTTFDADIVEAALRGEVRWG